jgi:hypothetical protein
VITISELLAHLAAIREQHGDLPVVLVDADTGWKWVGELKQFKATDLALFVVGDYGDTEVQDGELERLKDLRHDEAREREMVP